VKPNDTSCIVILSASKDAAASEFQANISRSVIARENEHLTPQANKASAACKTLNSYTYTSRSTAQRWLSGYYLGGLRWSHRSYSGATMLSYYLQGASLVYRILLPTRGPLLRYTRPYTLPVRSYLIKLALQGSSFPASAWNTLRTHSKDGGSMPH